jgi:hypothetical protein
MRGVVSVTDRPRFTAGERTPGIHRIGGWVGLRAVLDTEARGKIICLCRVSKPDRQVCSQDTTLTELPQLHVLSCKQENRPLRKDRLEICIEGRLCIELQET